MSRQLTNKEKVDVIEAYALNLEPMIEIAKRYQRTRQGIYKVLKQAGIDTSKRKMKVSCDCCQVEIERPRYQIRKAKHLFCSQACYYAWLEASQHGSYSYWHYGQHIARKKVAEVFALEPGHIVHHVDRNCYNNMLSNLMVFANQGDHVRYHRGCDANPIWSGVES